MRILASAALGVALLVAMACSSDDPEPKATPISMPTWAVQATAYALTPTPVPTATLTPVPPTATPVAPPRLQGLVTRPELTRASRSVTLPPPAQGVDLRGTDPEATRNIT